jgi:hypothetical protein
MAGYSRVLPDTPAVPLRVQACSAAAARPRAARAVPSCAGAYVSGAAGSNECPAGSVRIETEAACRTAAAAAGKTEDLDFRQTDAAYPRGCYYHTGENYAYFNPHPVGRGCSSNKLLCAALATTGARACAPACAAALRVCECGPHAQRRMGLWRCVRVHGGGERTLRVVRRGSDGGALRHGHGQCVYVH